MALEITLQHSGFAQVYSIKVESIEHTFTRMPSQSGFPAENEKFDSKTFLLDLGIKLEQLMISGVVDNSSDDASIPSKANMETVVRTWWGFGDSASNLIKIGLPDSQSYYGAIRNCNFRRLSGVPNKWDFSLTFLIAEKAA